PGTRTATYSGGSGTLQLKLDSGSFTTFTPPHTYSSLATGSHTVTLQDANLCQTSQTVTIVNPVALSLSLTKTDLTCNGVPTGTVTATFSGGTGTLQLQIDGGGYNTVTSPYTFTGLASGSHTVIVRDANLCTSTQTSTLTQPSAISLTLTKSDGCAGLSNGTLTATFSGGTGTLQLSLDGGSFTTYTSPHTYTSLGAGSHTVTLRDGSLCTTSQSVTLVNPPALSLSLTKTDLTCNGGGNGTITATF